jgi:uncharacterized protein
VKGPRPKHVPMRTCVACRQERPKRQLVRVVASPDGCVQIDLTGKADGRGAYICPSPDCWVQAIDRKVLDGALKTTLAPEDYVRLRLFADANLSEAASTTQ